MKPTVRLGVCSTITLVLLAVARLSSAQLSMVDLGNPPGADFSAAFGINSRGQIVGFGGTPFGANVAFLWEAGNFTDLASAPGRH
jgi:probable HAF family extracellular repeat protein